MIPNWPRLLLPHEKEEEERVKKQKLTNKVDAIPESRRVGVDPDLLNCPICYEPFRPPVYQCRVGHLVCKCCCNKIHNKCPSCSLPIGSNRCIAIEKIIESVLTSCMYTQHGCIEKLSYHKILEHEKICKYTPIQCPEFECEYIDMKFSFDLTARRGGKIISMNSPMEITPECVVRPDKEKCLLIRNDFHELSDGFKVLVLELNIRKVS